MYTNVYFFIHNNSLYSFIKQILYKCNNISKISIVKINLTYLYHLSLRVIKIYYTLTHSEKKKMKTYQDSDSISKQITS